MNKQSEKIKTDIRMLYNGSLKKPSNVAREYPALYSKARKIFGSWKTALEACGIDYEKARNRKKWSREKVRREIKKLHLKGQSLRLKELRKNGKVSLISAAAYHFGSWRKAVESSDIHYSFGTNLSGIEKKRVGKNNISAEIRMLNKQRFIYSKPINVYFEITIACDLTCKHCRAEAVPNRSLHEMNTGEIKEFLRDVKELGSHLIISGGDPLKREDLFEILSYAKDLKIPVGVTPTTSHLATYHKIKKMKELGIYALGISLDGATEKSQDSFRGVDGTFENSIRALSYAKELNIPVQVNTTCTKETITEIEGIYKLLAEKFSPPVKRWSIFHLVPTGRGINLQMPSSYQLKSLFQFLYEKSQKAPFRVTTTEAPHYRVYFVLKEKEMDKNKEEIFSKGRSLGFGVRDGNGIIFVSHKGDIYPSGFLSVFLGNVRQKKLSEVYKNNEILQAIRNPDLFKGKCGICPFRFICGGSRARAYATKGDFLETDPLCHFDEEFLKSNS
ncbi:MAG: radical SAM protein [Deltaproteobacteria bacterium]|nr:radical SAM protein [Deltaproteobacteria bacterium]